jgi:hypothetical protein
MDIKHCFFLSWFRGHPESHEQDGERLSRRRESGEQQRPAILPWRFEPGLAARPILIGPCIISSGAFRRRLNSANAVCAFASGETRGTLQAPARV